MNANYEKILPVKVVVIGPECTGKTELSRSLAQHFGAPWVPEYARNYIDNLTRPYNQRDLITIARGQLRMEDEVERTAGDLLICDTNLYVIKVWSKFKYGTVDNEILQQIKSRSYNLYLLTFIDLPWVDDPQREHPTKRAELYDIYLKEMKNQSTPFVEIKGDLEHRKKAAIDAIDKILSPA